MILIPGMMTVLLHAKIKDICNYRKGGNKGFDTVITRLQMQTYICIADFVYMKDKYGQPYGWGVAKYATPEAELGYDFTTSAYHRKPEESRERIIAHLKTVLPETDIEKLASLIK